MFCPKNGTAVLKGSREGKLAIYYDDCAATDDHCVVGAGGESVYSIGEMYSVSCMAVVV